MEYLVGSTGFVGSNLVSAHLFDGLFHSKNIDRAYGGEPDLLVYAGVRAEMFLANQAPEADYQLISDAIFNIKQINPKKIILISTIAVYPQIDRADEETQISEEQLSAYGRNRLKLEQWVERSGIPYLIVRLPALYGNNLKKNFLYDYINKIPTMLSQKKFEELLDQNKQINDFYDRKENGFYKVKNLQSAEKERLKDYFSEMGFSALNFTDSRAIYQFYNLRWLWEHIRISLEHNITKVNLVTEPIRISELYKYLAGKGFQNELNKPVVSQNFRTVYAELFGGSQGYIYQKSYMMNDIKDYIQKTIQLKCRLPS